MKTLAHKSPRTRSVLSAALCLTAAAALLGCGLEDEESMLPPDPGPGPGPGPMLPEPDKDAIRLNLGPVPLRPGEERTVCVTRRLSLPAAVNIVKVATRQKFSHHVIIYRHSLGTPQVSDTPKECAPLELVSGAMIKVPLFIGESADDAHNQIQLPPGVAYQLKADAYYTIEAHLLNATPKDAVADADVYLTPTGTTDKLIYADMMFYNNTRALNKSYDNQDAGLPPMKKTVADPAFTAVSDKLNVFGLTTHQHRLGVGVTISKTTNVSEPGTELFTNTDWNHPPLFRLPDDAPLTFKKGEGLRWVCTYDNTSNRYVRFGQSAETDEMCIIWGYYYPASGLKFYWD